MRTDYVPVDEGEAEAQPYTPPITVRLLHDGGQQAPLPWTVRFEVVAHRGLRVSQHDALLHEAAVRWLGHNGMAVQGDPDVAWQDVEGERCRTATYAVTGYQQ